MKALLVSLVAVLLGLGIAACGGAGRGTGSTPHASSSVAASRGAPGSRVYEAAPHHGLKNDGDVDPVGDADRDNSADNDHDPWLDYQYGNESDRYHDRDDMDRLNVGYVGSVADAKAITALVKRYYAVAVAGDGAEACAMMPPGFVKAVPLDYGKLGPSYLHGGKTCAAVVSLQFEHSRKQLTPAIQVTGVHFEHSDRAYAMFGSKTTPASFIAVVREGASWRIGALIGGPLP
jgi:hypothetical protein